MDYISKGSVKYLIFYYIILVTKYRHRLLDTIEKDIKQIILDLAKQKGFKIETMEVDKDHIHLLINSGPNISVFSIIKLIKQITTNRIWKLHSKYLRSYYWKRSILCSKGKFVCTIGNAGEKTIRKYIDSQG